MAIAVHPLLDNSVHGARPGAGIVIGDVFSEGTWGDSSLSGEPVSILELIVADSLLGGLLNRPVVGDLVQLV